ncbi:MAG: hypothetical protein U9N83_07005 [Thermodesulfobacteriota bacterium]|nr:hypothetical protein [Thermodesulfobacteriota bacterium]
MKTKNKTDKKGRKMSFENPVGTREYLPEWVEHLKTRYRGSSRPCRHAFTGLINTPKICAFNYECYRCAFDQMLDEPGWMNMVLFNSPSASATI